MTPSRKTPVLITDESQLDRHELEQQIQRASRRLAKLGVRTGSRVALLARPSADWVVLAHAIVRVGAILIPINLRLTGPEIERQLDLVRPDRLLTDEDGPTLHESAVALSFTEFHQVSPTPAEVDTPLDPNRPATILFSSGTTGRPRAVLLSWANQMASARGFISVLQLTRTDRWLAALPLYHVGGLNILYRCNLVGASVVLHTSFDETEINQSIDRHGVTIASFVPTMLRRLVSNRRGMPLPASLRAILLGGAPIPTAMLDEIPVTLATYGMTETCSAVTLVRPGSTRSERHSAGRPMPGQSIRIVDADGDSLPAGASGRIEVQGPNRMLGYLDDLEATATAIRDGWFATGDLGRVDENGSLHVIGRADERILSGGETIDPAEIEKALLDDPAVLETAVVGVDHPEWGETPVALVVPSIPRPTREELASRLRKRIAAYKLPRIVWVEEIPRLANGKPDSATIRERYGNESGLREAEPRSLPEDHPAGRVDGPLRRRHRHGRS